MFLNFLGKYREGGLLFMRIGLGLIFMMHGIPKLIGGPTVWRGLGKALGAIGIHFAGPLSSLTTFFGFMAAFAEGVGGALLILGLFFRPACLLLTFTMIVATMMLVRKGEPFPTYSHPLKMAVVFIGLMVVGPGKYSVDKG